MKRKTIEFGESDFSAVERAIQLERDKSLMGLDLMRRTWWERWGHTFLYVCGGIALLVIAASIAYWAWRYEPNTTVIQEPAKAAFPTEEAENRALDELDQSNYSVASVDTSFVVFNELVDDYGRIIVTGRKFEPTDLEVPVEQYCYLEVPSDSGLESITLAEYSSGLLNVVTVDSELSRLIEPYCNFTEPAEDY